VHKLLIADDSITVQRVIQLTFAAEDVAVEAVSDGDQAIARLEAAPPDIVLADVGMPGKDGYEVARYLKRSPRLSRIPVVLLTGAFEPVDRARADAAGCDGVLAKPFEPKQVVATVRELLNRPAETKLTSVEAAPSVAPVSSQASSETADEYLDQLQAAIADLSSKPAAPKPAPSDRPPAHRPNEPTLPTLAEAFAALLAAERRQRGPVDVTWPAAAASPVPGDAFVDEIAARVLAQLSDRVVRETVVSLVSPIAERLVREEIEKIKAAIK
jgi:CheY-like chemotaxis protein